MVIFALISLIIITVGSYYMISNNSNSNKFRDKSKKSQKIKTQLRDGEDLGDWLQQLHSIHQNLNSYYSKQQEYLANTNPQKQNNLIKSCQSILLKLDSSDLCETLERITSSDNELSDTSDQAIIIIQKLIEEINQLINNSSNISSIESKLIALSQFEEKIMDISKEHDELKIKNLDQELANEIIEDTMGIVPTLQLAETEFHRFLRFYFNYKAYRSLIPFLEIQLQEIDSYTHRIIDYLTTDHEVSTQEDMECILAFQPKLLATYKSFFDYFYNFYTGLEIELEALKNSNLREIQNSKTTIVSLIENLQELLEICLSFGNNRGNAEHEYNNFFNKIKNIETSKKIKKSLSIGLKESAQIFFESRAQNAQNLLRNDHQLKVDQIVSRVIRSFHSL